MVGITPFQIFYFLFNVELFDFEACELVCSVLWGFICGSGCAKIFDLITNILSI